MSQQQYLQPSALDDALAALATRRWAVLAGGTDFYAARLGRPIREAILDISRLAPLRGIAQEAGGWRVGALTTWTDVVRQPAKLFYIDRLRNNPFLKFVQKVLAKKK